MKVYISGQISGLPEEEYRRLFEDAEVAVLKTGYEPVSPLKVIPECNDECNSGLTFDDGTYQHAWKCYMKHDIIALLDCAAILLLPNWSRSAGARLELEVAQGLGLHVMTIVDNEIHLEVQ